MTLQLSSVDESRQGGVVTLPQPTRISVCFVLRPGARLRQSGIGLSAPDAPTGSHALTPVLLKTV